MRPFAKLGIALIVVLTLGLATLAGWYVGRDDSDAARSRAANTGNVTVQGTESRIADLQARIARQPNRAEVYTQLGSAYLQLARESGDPSAYGRAEAALQKALGLDAEDADALVALGVLALARHEFSEALSFGERTRDLNTYKAAAYGVIGDAQIELGRYDEAKATIQQMVDLRPDLSSYSRVSYVRELQGDTAGAIEIMGRAVEAGVAGTEGHAWTRVQLGHLYFTSGNLAAAEREYNRTLLELPEYLHARAGLARVKAARGDYAAAAAIYDGITKRMPLPEYVIALADVHRAAGNDAEAAQAEALVGVMDQLQRQNGVNTDLEMALFKADRDLDLAGTLASARQALARRPSIHGYDVLAWTLYKNGRYEEAMAASEQALRLGTRDSLMRYHAGMIALKLGLTERAGRYLREAVEQNPHFSLLYAADARRQLDSLASLPR